MRPVEAHRRRARLPILCARRSAGSERGTPASTPTFVVRRGLLARLDPFPLFEDTRLVSGARFGRAGVARRREDVRMPADQLRRHLADDVGRIESSGRRRHFRVKDDLEEHVAKLAAERAEIAAFDRVERFIRFFEKVRPQTPMCLPPIPRTAVWRSQRRHHLDEAGEQSAARAASPGRRVVGLACGSSGEASGRPC